MGGSAYLYRNVDRAWKTKFLTNQADNLCLAVRDATALAKQFVLGELNLQNRSGSTAAVSVVGRLPISLWKAGQVTSGGTFTDDTTNAQADVSDGFNLGTSGQANSGIILLCRIPFNVVSVVTTTVATGGTTFDLAYSTGTSTWTAITGSFVAPDWTPTAGEQLVAWPMPGPDWVVVAAGHGAGLPVDGPGWYGIRIRETAGNTAAGKARVLVFGVALYPISGLVTGNLEADTPSLGEIELPPQCDALAAFFSVSYDGNLARVRYRMKG